MRLILILRGLSSRVEETDDGSDASGAAAVKPKKKKEKMGLMESFRFLSRSKYLGYMSIMVLSYGLAMEFTEIVWKVRFPRRGKRDPAREGGFLARCLLHNLA